MSPVMDQENKTEVTIYAPKAGEVILVLHKEDYKVYKVLSHTLFASYNDPTR